MFNVHRMHNVGTRCAVSAVYVHSVGFGIAYSVSGAMREPLFAG